MAASPKPELGAWLRSAALKKGIVGAKGASLAWKVSRQAAGRWLNGYPIRDSEDLFRVAESIEQPVAMLVEGPWPPLTPPLSAEDLARCVEALARVEAALEALTARVGAIESAAPGETHGRASDGHA